MATESAMANIQETVEKADEASATGDETDEFSATGDETNEVGADSGVDGDGEEPRHEFHPFWGGEEDSEGEEELEKKQKKKDKKHKKHKHKKHKHKHKVSRLEVQPVHIYAHLELL
jgi:hypothetical protein